MSELRERIQTVIEAEPVALFMKGTPGFVMCGNSSRALEALRATGAPLTAVDILPDPRIRVELSEVSGWPTIPQVFIGGELVGGADIVEELAESGELRARWRAPSDPTTPPVPRRWSTSSLRRRRRRTIFPRTGPPRREPGRGRVVGPISTIGPEGMSVA